MHKQYQNCINYNYQLCAALVPIELNQASMVQNCCVVVPTCTPQVANSNSRLNLWINLMVQRELNMAQPHQPLPSSRLYIIPRLFPSNSTIHIIEFHILRHLLSNKSPGFTQLESLKNLGGEIAIVNCPSQKIKLWILDRGTGMTIRPPGFSCSSSASGTDLSSKVNGCHWIHVRHIRHMYPHLPSYTSAKCRQIYHTWILWICIAFTCLQQRGADTS